MAKIIYPNETPLQPIQRDIAPNTVKGMNTDQAQEIKSNLDLSGQTLDAQKLTENIRPDNFFAVSKNNSVLPWVITIFLLALLAIVLIIRFYQIRKNGIIK